MPQYKPNAPIVSPIGPADERYALVPPNISGVVNLAAVLAAGNSAAGAMEQDLIAVLLNSIDSADTGIGMIVAASDPSAGAGIAAAIGTILLRTNGQIWQKTGAPNASWTRVGTVTFGAAGDIGIETFGAAAVAGATGKVADAGHIHQMPAAPAGGGLLGYKANTAADATTQSQTFVDAHATNLAVTFTAPASGNVLVRLTAKMAASNNGGGVAGDYASWGLREGGSNIAGAAGTSIAARLLVSEAVTTDIRSVSMVFVLTGIAAGAHTYKWAFAVSAAPAQTVIYGAANSPSVMEVWELP